MFEFIKKVGFQHYIKHNLFSWGGHAGDYTLENDDKVFGLACGECGYVHVTYKYRKNDFISEEWVFPRFVTAMPANPSMHGVWTIY